MTDQKLLARKPSLLDLWMSYLFDTCALARIAGVDLDTVKAMLGCQSVKREDAQKIFAALSTIFQKNYTLETVYVSLIEEDGDDTLETSGKQNAI